MMNETLSIRYEKILLEVTELNPQQIWVNLMDFVLWGPPNKEEDLPAYCLYWAWKAIVMLQHGETAPSDGWSHPDSITAEVLGWKLQDVLDKKPRTPRAMGWSPDTTLVHTVNATVISFIDQSDMLYADSPKPKPEKLPTIGKWYWLEKVGAPATVVANEFDLNIDHYLTEVLYPTVTVTKHENVKVPDGFVFKYSTNWNTVFVHPNELSKIKLDNGELSY